MTKIYVTKHTKYHAIMVGGREAIPCIVEGRKAMPFGIIGFLDCNARARTAHDGKSVGFSSNESGKKIPYDNLLPYLSAEAKAGRRIVARLLYEDGRFVPEDSDDFRGMVTSPLERIEIS